MSKQPEDLEVKLTRWFDIKAGELPVRSGIYEGTLVGFPGGSYVMGHGYYYWDGSGWRAMGASPDDANGKRSRPAIGFVSHWRGLLE